MEIKEHPTKLSISYSAAVTIAEVSLAMVARLKGTDGGCVEKCEHLNGAVGKRARE